jgi:hypothetical protein
VLNEQLRDDVEVLFVLVEDVLHEFKHLLYVLQLEPILMDEPHNFEDGGLQHDFVASFEGGLTGVKP